MSVVSIKIDEEIMGRSRIYKISMRQIVEYYKLSVFEFTLNMESFENMLRDTAYSQALPNDFFVNGVKLDIDHDSIGIVISSKEFYPVKEMDMLPQYTFEITTDKNGNIEKVQSVKFEN